MGLYSITSLQRCYWISSSSGMIRQRLTTLRRIVAIMEFKKSRSYLTARSLFVPNLHMLVYVVAVTVQVGTLLPPTQVLVIRDLLNLCCQPWKCNCILTLQCFNRRRYWPDGWPLRDILTYGLFSRQKHVMCTVLRDVSPCERDTPQSIMCSLTPQSRHSLRLLYSAFICGRYSASTFVFNSGFIVVSSWRA
jgi:hypothetical protein